MVTLPTKKTQRSFDYRKFTHFIYGAPKVGKTTFASGLGKKPLFLDCEQSSEHLDRFTIPINAWADFEDAVGQLISEPHDFDVVVVDTVDRLRDLCLQAVFKRLGARSVNDPGFTRGFAGYQLLKQWFTTQIQALKAFDGFSLVMVGHEKTIEKKPNGDVIGMLDKYNGPRVECVVPSLSSSLSSFVCGQSDIVGRAYMEGIKRCLTVATQEGALTGTRSDALPQAPFELSSETYVGFFRDAYQKANKDTSA